MLTDEELTTRLSAAFHDGATDLEYAGSVPRVRHRGGLAATSVLAATAALTLAPAALQHTGDGTVRPSAGASTTPSQRAVPRVVHHHTLVLGTLHLTYATTAGQGQLLYLLGPSGVTVPSNAEQVDLGIPAQVWFASNPGPDEPQVYVLPDDSTFTYGILGRGWTHQQLVDLLEHPVSTHQGPDHQR